MNTDNSLSTHFKNVSAGGLISFGAYFSCVTQAVDGIVMGGGLSLIGVSSLLTSLAIDKSDYKPGSALAGIALVSLLTFGTDNIARDEFTCNLLDNCAPQQETDRITERNFN